MTMNLSHGIKWNIFKDQWEIISNTHIRNKEIYDDKVLEMTSGRAITEPNNKYGSPITGVEHISYLD